MPVDIRYETLFSGKKETQDAINQLPLRFLLNAVGVSGNFALTPLVPEIKKNTPVGTGLDSQGQARKRGGGHLRDEIGKRRKTYRKKFLSLAFVGYDLARAPHGTMIEAGTKPHPIRIKPEKGSAAEVQIWRKSRINLFGSLRFGATLKHPGITQIKPVLKAMIKSRVVVNRFASKMEKQIPKEVAKVAKRRAAGKKV